MQSFFSFHGRIGRTTYWLAVFTAFVLFLGGAAMIALAGSNMAGTLSAVAGVVLVAAGAWISWATTVTRLHDTDHSGFLALVILVPLGSLGLMAYCGLAAGTPGMNDYGAPPRLGGSGYLDEAMAAFEEPDGERRSASVMRKAAAQATASAPATMDTPPRAAVRQNGPVHPGGSAGRPSFGRRSLSTA
ncbi:DUF805 domain-containing protein [Jiella pacifica]|uniref:DUF805 domain-containing protein n=1 Tax=Jiella pacifica TaxID=2696469 RepID=A0A6N9SY45_9HYPH|nr:DUF805 domain-containing protein [Jiella pacifica]NDW04004.1 DUF805 domain-containing protein [Jiella pacifica]